MEKNIFVIVSILACCVLGAYCIPHQDAKVFRQDFTDEINDGVTTTRSDIDDVEIELELGEELADQKLNSVDVDAVQPSLIKLEGDKDNTLFPDSTKEPSLADEVDPNENTPTNSSGLPYHVGKADCTCGKTVTKIVGGDLAKINDLPWTALLYRKSFFGFSKSAYCGGTLINNLYVVTASHCVDGMGARGIEVVLKEENTATSSESETQVFKVEKIIMHPNYSRRNIDNDIALLKLSRPVVLTDPGIIAPACVAIKTEDKFVGQDAIAAGWGATSEGGSVSKQLRKVTVPVISNEDCNMTKYKGKITENMLCAGLDKGGKDSCQGDSGGPLVTATEDRKMLIGVVSWGYGCARPNSPGVYTRVANYPDFILSNTEDAEWCSN